MEQHQHVMVNFLSRLGKVWGYASHNKPDGFGRERLTFGDKTISTTSYCFQKNSRVNIEQQECFVIFCDFSGFVWTFLCIKWVFNAFMCIIQIWTTCTCSSAYKLVEKQLCVLGCMLRSHARNEIEFQTPGHRWLPAKHWDAWFLNSRKSKTRLKFMKLGVLSLSGINMPWYKFCPIWDRFGYKLLTNQSFSRQAWWFR